MLKSHTGPELCWNGASEDPQPSTQDAPWWSGLCRSSKLGTGSVCLPDKLHLTLALTAFHIWSELSLCPFDSQWALTWAWVWKQISFICTEMNAVGNRNLRKYITRIIYSPDYRDWGDVSSDSDTFRHTFQFWPQRHNNIYFWFRFIEKREEEDQRREEKKKKNKD